jgi:transposase
MAKHTPIHLSSEERSRLNQLISSGNAPARVQTRARILLLRDSSQNAARTHEQTAAALQCAPATVQNICRRFRPEGVDAALSEKPRPGNPRKLDGAAEAQLAVLACSDAPAGYARWTWRLLADRLIELGVVESLSVMTVRETLKKTNSSLGASRPGASATITSWKVAPALAIGASRPGASATPRRST